MQSLSPLSRLSFFYIYRLLFLHQHHLVATNTTVDLAPQQIVDCDNSDDGCGGGDPPTAYEYLMSAGGLEAEKDYPYKGEDGSCKVQSFVVCVFSLFPLQFNKADVVASISAYKTISRDEKTLQSSLVRNQG